MFLSNLGKIVDECWHAIPDHFPFVELGAYVIMPNHVHGIIVIRGARYIVPLRRNNFKNLLRVQFQLSYEHSRLLSLVALDTNTIPPASGNTIITNTSSAMKRISKIKPITSKPIPCCGMRMIITHEIFPCRGSIYRTPHI
jgi:hypothetical protein